MIIWRVAAWVLQVVGAAFGVSPWRSRHLPMTRIQTYRWLAFQPWERRWD